jgi:hypothetical protein
MDYFELIIHELAYSLPHTIFCIGLCSLFYVYMVRWRFDTWSRFFVAFFAIWASLAFIEAAVSGMKWWQLTPARKKAFIAVPSVLVFSAVIYGIFLKLLEIPPGKKLERYIEKERSANRKRGILGNKKRKHGLSGVLYGRQGVENIEACRQKTIEALARGDDEEAIKWARERIYYENQKYKALITLWAVIYYMLWVWMGLVIRDLYFKGSIEHMVVLAIFTIASGLIAFLWFYEGFKSCDEYPDKNTIKIKRQDPHVKQGLIDHAYQEIEPENAPGDTKEESPPRSKKRTIQNTVAILAVVISVIALIWGLTTDTKLRKPAYKRTYYNASVNKPKAPNRRISPEETRMIREFEDRLYKEGYK